MKPLIDFDRQYMLFAAEKLKGKGDMKDGELESLLNSSMSEWLNTKAQWLDDKTPDEFFAEMENPDLIKALTDYAASNLNVPEPLYRQISLRKDCGAQLADITMDTEAPEKVRATALRLICDMGSDNLEKLCVELIAAGGEVSEIASDQLKRASYNTAKLLLDKYDLSDEDTQETIMEVLCCFPGLEGVAERLSIKLLSEHEKRAQHAVMAEKLGDPALIEPLLRLAKLSDLTYYDYKEIVNAIDALGGDPGEERQFYGDPDYEIMRDPNVGLPEDWAKN